MLYFIQLIPPESLLLSEGKQKRSRSGGEERREGKLGGVEGVERENSMGSCA